MIKIEDCRAHDSGTCACGPVCEAEYTPSDIRVRQVWEEFAEMKGSKKYPDEIFAQFDRWLAQHDARVSADALDRAGDAWAAVDPAWIDCEQDVWLRSRAASILLNRGAQQ